LWVLGVEGINKKKVKATTGATAGDGGDRRKSELLISAAGVEVVMVASCYC